MISSVMMKRAAFGSIVFIWMLASGAAYAAQCKDADRKDLNFKALSEALEACFTEIGGNIALPGETVDRLTVLSRLHRLEASADRKMAFYALGPLWRAVNGNDQLDSPYRRLLAMAPKQSARMQADQANLVRILEAWSQHSATAMVEPWDYWSVSGEVERLLKDRIAKRDMLPITKRFYRDLGADLDTMQIVYDLEPRAGKSSVAYTDFKRHGRYKGQRWIPTIAFISATYREGSLSALNELVHENGHAAHISAIRYGSPTVDWPADDVFTESFADVASWSTYEPSWQRRYLGVAAGERASLRALFNDVILDVAWALFEQRMLAAPKSDPNRVWTDITSQYLGVVPHPEISWWAIRGQLVNQPGYMFTYGYGAMMTAELRERTRQLIGDCDTGNPRWYPLLSKTLLRFGKTRDAAKLVRKFLRHRVSPDALLRQFARLQE